MLGLLGCSLQHPNALSELFLEIPAGILVFKMDQHQFTEST